MTQTNPFVDMVQTGIGESVIQSAGRPVLDWRFEYVQPNTVACTLKHSWLPQVLWIHCKHKNSISEISIGLTCHRKPYLYTICFYGIEVCPTFQTLECSKCSKNHQWSSNIKVQNYQCSSSWWFPGLNWILNFLDFRTLITIKCFTRFKLSFEGP